MLRNRLCPGASEFRHKLLGRAMHFLRDADRWPDPDNLQKAKGIQHDSQPDAEIALAKQWSA